MAFRKLGATSASVVVAIATAAAPASVAKQPKLRAGEFCSIKRQHYYKRHGYICKKSKDGRYRLSVRQHPRRLTVPQRSGDYRGLAAIASANQFCGTAKRGIYRVSKSGPITCPEALKGFRVVANTHHEPHGWSCRTFYRQLRAGCRVPGGSHVVGRWKDPSRPNAVKTY